LREEVTSSPTYLLVGLALIVMAAVSILSSLVNLGGFNPFINAALALASAYLIVTYFMRLRVSPPLLSLVAAAGLLWLGILLAGTLDDYLTRGWLPFPGK
jgi:cytochrome c oxidase subunit 4